MSTLNRELTVGEIAAQSPVSIRVFERRRIDFCCGGKTPFDAACIARGLDPEAVLQEIDCEAARIAPASADSDGQWQSAPLGTLADHILSTHHAYLKTQLPRIAAMFDQVLAAHGSRHGAMLEPLAASFFAMQEELNGHLMKEEMVLFPLIRKIEESSRSGQAFGGYHCGSVQNPIRVMVMEHDSAGEALSKMRQITKGYAVPDDACATFQALFLELGALESDLHRHIHLENNILFPRAVEVEASVMQ
jgi:regulator of cell morphogenesis and NO signaling